MYIDSAIQMKDINELKRELTKYNISRIAYAVKPSNLEYHINYYDNFVYSNINFAYRQKPIYNKQEPEQPVDDIRNTLKPLDLEDEDAEYFGAADIDQLSWKQILDGYSCTECGRCDSVCPANFVGKSLSPRNILGKIRKRTEDKGALLVNGIAE